MRDNIFSHFSSEYKMLRINSQTVTMPLENPDAELQVNPVVLERVVRIENFL